MYLKRQTAIDTDYGIFSDDEIFAQILCQMTKINWHNIFFFESQKHPNYKGLTIIYVGMASRSI